jgi:Uma2 family endonuclease
MVSIPKISKLSRPSKVYTFEQYLSREERNLEKHEFYNGKILKTPNRIHTYSEINANMGTALKIGMRQIERKFHVCSNILKNLYRKN